MIDQRRLVQALAAGIEPHTACQQEGISWNRFRNWLADDQAFGEAFDRLGSSVDTAKAMLENMAVKAVSVFDEAIGATHVIEAPVTCPSCEKSFMAMVETANMGVRMKAADVVLRGTKILKDVKEISGTLTHLTLEDKIALAQYRRGLSIPPHVERKLRQLGRLTDPPAITVTVEGEATEVPA